MPDKEFAAGYPREGPLILFPRDVTWRRQLFPKEVFEHPAKANMYLIQELYRYLTEPGDSILDPFAGTGTLMIALAEERNVVLIDIEQHYIDLIHEAMETRLNGHWPDVMPGRGGNLFVFQGDCRQKLPDLKHLCDAAIFSPPYSTAVGMGQTNIKEMSGEFSQYSGKGASAQNLGRLNPFYFIQAMDKVYERIATRLVPAAPLAIITKDTMSGPRRMLLSDGIIRQATKAGFKLEEWHKWKPPGSMQQSIMRSKGANVVDDEDIIIFRKGQ